MRTHPTTVSLFCGGGGETAGKIEAFRELGIDIGETLSHAVNHWDLAVLTHRKNYPWIRVHQEDITQITARDFGLERINLLWASPSCVHHSRARGGKPKEEQQRSHAWEVMDRWLRVANVDVVLVENVPEFMDWGPLDDDGQPIKGRKGEDFRAFVAQLEALGYKVEWRVLCAADYGDPTIRKRFFMQAVRDGKPIRWPEPSHRNPKALPGLFDAPLPPWRTAAECIDWDLPCPSIFDRKRPLAEATNRRIAEGVMKFVVNHPRPFILNLSHGGRIESLDKPMNTLTAGPKGGDRALVVPTLIQTGYGERKGQAPRCLDIQAPLGTIVAAGQKHALVSVFLAKHYSGVIGQSVESPLGTVTSVDHHSAVEVQLTKVRTLAEGGPLSDPGSRSRHGLVAAFIAQYYSDGGQLQGMDSPLHAVTTVGRHALVTVNLDGDQYAIGDIGMRMLEPHELAKAMGFPEWYRWETSDGRTLTKRDKVKMIGNAVPVNTCKALVKAVVNERPEAFGLVRRAS